MSHRILTLSPGSTSTKVAVFDADGKGEPTVVLKVNVRHDPAELAAFEYAADQLDYRVKTITDALDEAGLSLADMDAFSGYCGGMGPTKGGIFEITQTVCDHTLTCGMNHPAILGAPILHSFSQKTGKPAFAVNQPDTDELADVARITGYPGVYRKSHVHCLNQKEVAIRFAHELGIAYDEGNFIVAHVGGGLSVAAHDHGRMVDANDVLEGSGPFAPNRSGDVPLRPVVEMCYAGTDKREVVSVIGKTGGGVDEYFGLAPDDIDIKYGTLSKGLGTCGGYLAGSHAIIDYMRYNLPGFVFSVGISPALAAASLEAIHLLKKDPSIVQRLHRNIQCFMEEAHKRNLNTCLAGETAILPILVGSDEDAWELSNRLRKKGVIVPPAVYPAVPKNKARLRFCVISEHQPEEIVEALDKLVECAKEAGIQLPPTAGN